MSDAGLRLIRALFRKKIAKSTRQHLADLLTEQRRASNYKTFALLEGLAAEPGPHVVLGETHSGQRVSIPSHLLAAAHGIATGGSGSGKTGTATIAIEAMLASSEMEMSFGVLDAKRELFERALFLVRRALEVLPPAAANRLRERLVIIDLAAVDPLTSLNIAAPWSGGDLDFFSSSRTETLSEIFPSADGLSLRGNSIVRHTLKLLAEQRVPFRHFDQVLSSEDFRARLVAESKDEELRHYFAAHFANEGKATIAAVRARVNATLFSSASLRLALSGVDAPDFRAYQDEGAIVLISTGGANIPRSVARTFQSVLFSDIRQGVFARRNQRPFVWWIDEAQHCFQSKFLRENALDLLTMSRSFGSHCAFLTQNISTAVQDSEILEQLFTNIKWSLTFRSTPKDAAFLQAGFPVSGSRQKPRTNPYAPAEFYSPAEERALLLQAVSHLPDRDAWFWLKSLTGEAFRIRTRTIDIPTGAGLREAIEPLRADPNLGRRHPRKEYLKNIAHGTMAGAPVDIDRDIAAELTDLYRASEATKR